MRRLAVPASALAVVLLALPASAQVPVLVDFDEYRRPTTTELQATVGLPLSSNGLDFYETSLINGGNSRNVLATWGTSDPGSANIPVNIGSSTAMFATVLGLEIDIYPTGSDIVLNQFSGAFSMYSIDVAHLYSTRFSSFTPAPLTLQFFGFGPSTGGAVISQSFVVPVPPLVGGFRDPVLTTLAFDERWRSVKNVWWFQGSGSGSAHQFTNVSAAIVPEPSTYLLMLTGLGGLGAVWLRRRRALA